MREDLFKYLPPEMILNILSRLPIRTTVICKCVCKPWLDLLSTPEFVKFHLSKSVPCLAGETSSNSCETLQFVDDYRSDSFDSVFSFKLPFDEPIHSSVNGLLLLGECNYRGSGDRDLILCNPVTRDYIKIMLPRLQPPSSEHRILVEAYGFGVSRVTGQYKVVNVFTRPRLGEKCDQFECQVYTVGTGSWRNVARGSPISFKENKQGVFLNGNLHWLVLKLAADSYCGQILCLDLEKEVFSIISPPPPDIDRLTTCRKLSVLRDSLCVCDNSYGLESCYRIEIWLMKEYGDDKSWTKEFIIPEVYMDKFAYVRPIKVFKDGVTLLEWGRGELVYYSNKTKSIDVDFVSEEDGNFFSCTAFYTPSFLSLKSFAMENVSSF